jgi:type I restriction enzyme S subunit
VSWLQTTLGKSFELYQPQTITTKDLVQDGEYPVYGANGVIGYYNKYNHEEPQLLVTCRGATCGAVNVSQPFSWINGNAMVVKPKTKDIDIRFVEYFFRGAVNLSKAITGAAQPQITRQSLSPIIFHYPPLPIQEKIVKKLDSIFAEIEKSVTATQANIKNVDAVFQKYLAEIFERNDKDWSLKKLSEVISFDKQQGIYKNIPYLGLENIESDTTKLVIGLEAVNEVKSSTFKFNNTHLLYGRLRPYLNKVFLPSFDGHCSTEIFPIKPSKIISREYLKFWFINSTTVSKINATCTGARMPRANMNTVMEFDIPVPPLSTQQELVTKFTRIQIASDTAKNSYRAKLANLISLKQKILNKTFVGQLV